MSEEKVENETPQKSENENTPGKEGKEETPKNIKLY